MWSVSTFIHVFGRASLRKRNPAPALWSLCLCIWHIAAHAQPDILPVYHYGHYDGLPKKLYTICNDPDGFIWLGGDNGVYRFDGKTFHHYGTRDGLCDSEILAMFADSKGRIWCAGFNGKVSVIEDGVVDTQSPFIRRWPNPEVIRDFAEDSLGRVYFISEKNELLRVDTDGQLSRWQLKGLGMSSPRRLVIRYGRLLVGDNGSNLFELDPLADTLNLLVPRRLGEPEIAKISRESDDVWEVNPETGRARQQATGQTLDFPWKNRQKLSGCFFSQPDPQHVLLSMMDAGVFLYHLPTRTRRRLALPSDALVPELACDGQGQTWMITPDDGLYAFRLGNGARKPEPLPGFEGDILASHEFRGKRFAVTAEGEWITSAGPGKRHSEWLSGKKSMLSSVHIFETGDSLYLVGPGPAMNNFVYDRRLKSTSHAGNKAFLRYRDSVTVGRSQSWLFIQKEADRDTWPTLHRGRTYDMCLQGDVLWFSGVLGLYGYNLATDSLYGCTLPMPHNGRVERIQPLGGRMQIICTSNAGLWLLIDGKKVLLRLTEENGLLENDCKELDTYSRGWIVRHPAGMSKITRSGLYVQTVSEWAGMPLSAVRQVTVSGDSLLLATGQGLFGVDIESLFRLLPERRRVRFLQVHSKGKTVYPHRLVLEPSGNHLRIDFALPEYGHPERVQYRWRINDEPWTKTANTSLEFADLGPGSYRLQVMATAPGFASTGISTLEFRVRQPFWQNLLFWTACTATLLLALWLVLSRRYRRKLAQEREQATIRHRLLSYEQKALNAMMNPHFVFNAMGSIQYLLHDGHAEQANNYLVKFSRLIRKTLESSQRENSLLDDEIERLVLYLQMEKLRLEENLTFTVDVEDGLDAESVSVPGMILQTYVENAVIHGMTRGSVQIALRFGTEAGAVKVVIEDDGPGFDPGNPTRRNERFGLSATEKRLELLSKITGKPYRVEVLSPVHAQRGGTRITLYFPVS